jgi:hypothetical protein
MATAQVVEQSGASRPGGQDASREQQKAEEAYRGGAENGHDAAKQKALSETLASAG